MNLFLSNRLPFILALLGLSGIIPQGLGAPASVIEIGSSKQLFIDDSMIQSLSHAGRVMNPAVKHVDNPVLKRDRAWEGNFLSVSRVLYDPADGLFKMWYSSQNITARPVDRPLKKGERMIKAAEYEEAEQRFCYAISKDGVRWEKPSLGLVSLQGSTDNNILPKGSRMHNLFLDPQ